jgi:hypothetical protein
MPSLVGVTCSQGSGHPLSGLVLPSWHNYVLHAMQHRVDTGQQLRHEDA